MSAGHESEPDIKQPYFFLSYARTPRLDSSDTSDPDSWVHKLYRDLCDNILGMTSAQSGVAGFMDRNNRAGSIWTRELSQALASCRVFVPLYSRRYFNSENCGKEWFAFTLRKAEQMARGLKPADAIVPALWAPVRQEDLPDVARDIQYIHADFGARYGMDGFFGLIKLKRYQEDYEVAVWELARRIVDVADKTQLTPEEPTTYSHLESAFGSRTSDSPEMVGDRLRITVLALDTGTLPKGRKVDHYGSKPEMWNPYLPASPQPLAEYAADLAACFGCPPAVDNFDEHTANWATNGQPIPPGLCLIDPWVTLSPAHQERLQRLDKISQPWVSVMVLWNSEDAEMTAAQEELRKGLALTLGHKLSSVPERWRMAATGIPTLRDFGQILPRMIMIMLKRFRNDENAPAYPAGGPHLERPRLRGANSENSGGP